METLFELTFQDQTLNPQVGTFTDTSQTTGTFTLEDGEYYLTNGDTKGFYAYSPVAMQSGIVDDSKVIIEFDLKVVTASANTHTIIGTYAGVDGSGIPTGAKITLQYNAGDIELVLDSGATATLIESADVVVDQWYHFRIDRTLAASLASTYQVKIDGVSVTTVTGATTDYELGIISVLGTDLHACDECGIKNITLVTETNMYVGRTALNQAFTDTKGYVDAHFVPIAGTNALSGSIVPDTDNAYDLGDGSHNIKIVYAKEIRHGLSSGSLVLSGGNGASNGANLVLYGTSRSDGFQGRFDLVAKGSSDYKLTGKSDGTLTWDGDTVDTIEEQGNGYIRYSNGIQICWGTLTWQSDCTNPWGSLFESGAVSGSYAKSFVENPAVSISGDLGGNSAIIESNTGSNTSTPSIWLCRANATTTVLTCTARYIAIGRWK